MGIQPGSLDPSQEGDSCLYSTGWEFFSCNSFPLVSGGKKSFVEDDVSQQRVEFSNIFQGGRRNTSAALLHLKLSFCFYTSHCVLIIALFSVLNSRVYLRFLDHHIKKKKKAKLHWEKMSSGIWWSQFQLPSQALARLEGWVIWTSWHDVSYPAQLFFPRLPCISWV